MPNQMLVVAAVLACLPMLVALEVDASVGFFDVAGPISTSYARNTVQWAEGCLNACKVRRH